MPLIQSRMQIGDVDLEVHRGGEGPPLYFAHGAGADPKAPFLDMLTKTFSVTMVLHPGFGSSSLPFWMDAVDDFVHIHLNALKKLDLSNVTLVGGWVAADLATKNTSRIARIVLVSPVGIKVGPNRLAIHEIRRAQGGCSEGMLGLLIHIHQLSLLNDFTIAHERNAMRQGQRLLLIMGHINGRMPKFALQ